MNQENSQPSVTAADFKKHISKEFGEAMRKMGFKGSGFHFRMESDAFIFTVGIQGSQWGPSCCAEFGIQPKALTSNGFGPINLKTIKYSSCEFRERLSPTSGDHWWEYSRDPEKNVGVAQEIASLVLHRVMPKIDYYKSNPRLLEDLSIVEIMRNDEGLWKHLQIGVLSYPRFLWMLAVISQKTDSLKAKEIARFALSRIESNTGFFAFPELQRMANL